MGVTPLPVHQDQKSGQEESYKAYLELHKYSPVTIQNELYHLRAFIQNSLSQEWVNSYLRRHNNYTTRAFLKHYIRYIGSDTLRVPKIKGKKHQPQTTYLTQDEIQTLIDNIPDLRYATLVQLCFETGLRISEALSITPNHIDFNNLTIGGVGKGNKQYEQPITQDTANALTQLSENLFTDRDRIFSFGRRRAHEYITQHSKRILDKSIHPHTIRHSTAMHLRSQKLPIEEIKEYMRHEDIRTTNRYAKAYNTTQIKQTVRTYF